MIAVLFPIKAVATAVAAFHDESNEPAIIPMYAVCSADRPPGPAGRRLIDHLVGTDNLQSGDAGAA